MAYAERTTVPMEKSIAETITLIKRAGAVRCAQYDEPEGFQISFELHDRLIRFRVPFPKMDDMPQYNGNRVALTVARRREMLEQAKRQKARALMLVIKAKLESIESGVETFEEAFLPNIVLANKQTVYERIREPISIEYSTGVSSTNLLAGPTA